MRTVLRRIWAARRAIAVYAALLALGAVAGEWMMGVAVPEMRPMNEPMIHRIVMTALVVFVVAAALPFVPGAEIGFALLLIFGGQASALVYAGMVGALILSFCVARLVPFPVLSRLATWLGLARIASLIDEIGQTPPPERADYFSDRMDGRFGKAAFRNRYVLLALLLNTPGNSVIGGGGGIAFTAGLTGMYRFWPYLASVLIAVAPFPLFFLVFGG